MLEMPNDAVSELKTGIFENVVKIDVERVNFPVFYIIADFPADTSFWCNLCEGNLGKLNIRVKVAVKIYFFLVDFADIVGRGRDEKINGIIIKAFYEFKCVTFGYCIFSMKHKLV
jgi:hypothetical protein